MALRSRKEVIPKQERQGEGLKYNLILKFLIIFLCQKSLTRKATCLVCIWSCAFMNFCQILFCGLNKYQVVEPWQVLNWVNSPISELSEFTQYVNWDISYIYIFIELNKHCNLFIEHSHIRPWFDFLPVQNIKFHISLNDNVFLWSKIVRQKSSWRYL